jgi:hypothetical protein
LFSFFVLAFSFSYFGIFFIILSFILAIKIFFILALFCYLVVASCWHYGSGGTCLAMGAMLRLSFDALLA